MTEKAMSGEVTDFDPAEPDPADAFARVPREQIDRILLDDAGPRPGPAETKEQRKERRRKEKKARAPTIEPEVMPAESATEDPPMSAEDVADEIAETFDSAFAMLCGLRGYDRLAMPDGTTLISHVEPTQKEKDRFRRAVLRFIKAAGVQMSPGAGFAMAALTCYGAPIATLEFARYKSKPA